MTWWNWFKWPNIQWIQKLADLEARVQDLEYKREADLLIIADLSHKFHTMGFEYTLLKKRIENL
jgi:hypothetical protein